VAHIVRNDWMKPGETKGFRFEDQVREGLRTGLPDTYQVLQQAVLEGRERTLSNARPRPGDADFIVAGPNGLFVLEVKYLDAVRGKLFGNWVYGRRDARPGDVDGQSALESPGFKLKVNLDAAGKRVKRRRAGALMPYNNGRGLFVFPPNAQLEITDFDGQARESFEHGMLRLVRLPRLCETILATPPPEVGKNGPPAPPLQPADVLEIIQLFDAGTRPDPSLVNDYRILGDGSFYVTPNGVAYGVFALEHTFTKRRWRGKWYDLSTLGDGDRQDFDARVRRHAEVLNAVGDHDNILAFHDVITNLPGAGLWVIEAHVEGDLLSTLLAAGAPPPARELARGIADALRAIHKRRFVCRDLGPGAVLVERGTGRPYLTSFELAKSAEASRTVLGPSVDLSEGDYRAPEVRRGAAEVDARADLYSWGAILFHVVTGQPFRTVEALPLLDRADLPPRMAELVRKCLAPFPSDRPAGIDVVLGAIRGWR
jgi:hypothetical protein